MGIAGIKTACSDLSAKVELAMFCSYVTLASFSRPLFATLVGSVLLRMYDDFPDLWAEKRHSNVTTGLPRSIGAVLDTPKPMVQQRATWLDAHVK